MCFFKEARAIKKSQALEASTQWVHDKASVFELLKQFDDCAITMSTVSPYTLILSNPKTGTTTKIGGTDRDTFWAEARERLENLITINLLDMVGYKS